MMSNPDFKPRQFDTKTSDFSPLLLSSCKGYKRNYETIRDWKLTDILKVIFLLDIYWDEN